MLKRLFDLVDVLPKSLVVLLALVLTALVGAIDRYTGYEASFAVFYLLPVSLVAWRLGAAAGIALSAVDALTWHYANALAGHNGSNEFIPYWNTITRLIFFVVVTILLSQLRAMLHEERRFARTDSLTGALNGRAFRELLSIELLRAKRHDRPLSMAYLDLDNFKTVNDTLGHGTGDRLLCEVVRLIRVGLRPADAIARLGGDEFALLLPETDARQAAHAIMRIQSSVAAEMESKQWPVTLSVGMLTCSKRMPTADSVIQRADNLMYRAKNGGKNAIVYEEFFGER